MRSTGYVYMFVGIMTVVVGLILSFLAVGLKPLQDKQEALFNKKAVLAAIETQLGEDVKASKMAEADVLNLFDNNIEQRVIDYYGNEVSQEDVEARGYKGGQAEHVDMKKEKKKPAEERIFPVFTYDNGGESIYIVSIRGNGLWDEIWGSIALESDLSTIAGTAFDHRGETPGLGAEIKDNPTFPARFIGKKIYTDAGELVSVDVMKGKAPKGDVHAVDGITGATVTAKGVAEMMDRGVRYYEPYLNQLKMK